MLLSRFFLSLSFLLLLGLKNYASIEKEITLLDTAGDVGLFTAITVDNLNHTHISYLSKDSNATNIELRYATNSSGKWTIKKLYQPRDLSYTAIGWDQDNDVPVAFKDGPNIYYIYANQSSLTPRKVQTTYYPTHGPSLSIAIIDTINYYDFLFPAYSYDSFTGYYYFALLQASSSGFQYGMALSATTSPDAPCIVYIPENKRFFSFVQSNTVFSWICSDYSSIYAHELDIPKSTIGSLAIGKSNRYAVLDSKSTVKDLRKILPDSLKGLIWQFSSIAVDSNDYVHISCFDKINCRLLYFNNIGGKWTSVTIDSSSDRGDTMSVIVEKIRDTYPRLSTTVQYFPGMYQRSIGEYNSIAIDKNQNIQIAYYDRGNGNLKLCTMKNPSAVLIKEKRISIYKNIAALNPQRIPGSKVEIINLKGVIIRAFTVNSLEELQRNMEYHRNNKMPTSGTYVIRIRNRQSNIQRMIPVLLKGKNQ